MLSQLTIHNYAIVETLDLELKTGMTVVTGETGAGKSIMLDALGLALGARAEAGAVRAGAQRAEIIASFDISALDEAKQWLSEHDLDLDGECILRRVITKEGRSRSYINQQPCPLNALRELGQFLLDIHGQHEHQRLLKKDHHRELLDNFAGLTKLAAEVRGQFNEWRSKAKRQQQLQEQSQEHSAQVQLLSYQIEELEQLALADGEPQALEQEQKQLANAGEILQTGHQLMQLTSEGEGDNCVQLLHQSQQLLAGVNVESDALQQAAEMLASALIQVEEAGNEVRHYMDTVEMNPARLEEVDHRLSSLYDIARKHQVTPDELPGLLDQLQQQLSELQHSDEELERLEGEVEESYQAFATLAEELHQQRKAAGELLSEKVNEQLHRLGMPNARFEVSNSPLATDKASVHGIDDLEFLIMTNPGQPAKPLAKIASGGELSRISLAIQVVTAQTSVTPTLIFDEVDVGIGGAIAEVVGQMLRQLGNQTQVLCVTHQPQVASQGHQHLFVRKQASNDATHTCIDQLSKKRRVEEVARMLGGIDITRRSMSHAREMLANA